MSCYLDSKMNIDSYNPSSGEMASPAVLKKQVSFDGFGSPWRSPLVELESASASPNPYKFEVNATEWASREEPVREPMLDFDSVANDGQFILGALPLIIPPGCNAFDQELAPMAIRQEAAPQQASQQVAQQSLPEKPVEMQIVEQVKALEPISVKVEAPEEAPATPARAPKDRKRKHRPCVHADRLREMLQDHGNKMDLDAALSTIAGLPVVFTERNGERCLGKYTPSQRKIRLERFKKKFVGCRPTGPRKKYASRSRFAKRRKRVGGRFVKGGGDE
jgi:hypothetical protein